MNWNEKRYHSLDYELKKQFGEKVYRLSIDAGFTCPNRDGTLGTRGCIFCSEGGSGDFAIGEKQSVFAQLEAAKSLIRKKTDCSKFIAYFQAFTNTYAPVADLRQLYTEAMDNPEIVALSIATRPDCLPGEVLDLLGELNQRKPVWVELGLQTIHPDSAAFIRRGFPLEVYDKAVKELHARHITVITHVILGLPGETKEDMLKTVDYVAKANSEGIKLHLLHVLRNTDLGSLYECRPFPLFSLEEYCDFICTCLEHLPPEMVVHRLTGDGPKNLLIAPEWSKNKRNVLNLIHRTLKEKDSWQGKYYVR